MSFSSLSHLEENNISKTFKQKIYNYYKSNKPKENLFKSKFTSLDKLFDSTKNDIVKFDDTSIYHEINFINAFEISTPSTPTPSLYDYINFVDETHSDSTSTHYHYPVFKFKSLSLDDCSSITDKSEYLSLYDVSLKKTEVFQVVKERFLAMSLFEKRQFYKCGYNFVTLDEIPTWSSNSATTSAKKQASINDKISLLTGNITAIEVDAVVNTTGTTLAARGFGVNGCIHFAAGKKYLQAECQSLNGCERGQCKITGGYRLPAKYIIHCVGPIGENAALLASCYKNALDTLKANNLRSIAFPCISTGIYCYPQEKAVPVVLKTVKRWLKVPENAASIDRIVFVLFLDQDTALYYQHMPKYFPR